MAVPAPITAFFENYNESLALVANNKTAIDIVIMIMQLAGWKPSVTDQLTEISNQITEATNKILHRLDQIEDVPLIGDVIAQTKNLEAFAKADEEAKNAIGANIITTINSNDSKLQIAIDHAIQNGDPTRASLLATKRVENWCNLRGLKESDALRGGNSAYSGINADAGDLHNYVDRATDSFKKSLNHDMPLRESRQLVDPPGGVGPHSIKYKIYCWFNNQEHVYAQGQTTSEGVITQARDLAKDVHENFMDGEWDVHEHTKTLRKVAELIQ